MPTLHSILPDPKDLLALEPEDLAGVLIEAIPGITEPVGFTVGALVGSLYPAQGNGYPPVQRPAVTRAIGEALSWLVMQGLVMQNPSPRADWFFLTRRGAALKKRTDVEAFQKGRTLPLDLLSPTLAEKVRPLFLRGDYDTAVFQAFKEIEIAVRKIGGYRDDLVGVQLMREAFHVETGKLTDKTAVPAERHATRDLFVAAIGLCKNPGSHRDVNVEREDAARLIVFASYLERLLLKVLLS